MGAHSSILAWKTPWPEKPGRLQSTGLQRAGYDLATEQQHQSSVPSKTNKQTNKQTTVREAKMSHRDPCLKRNSGLDVI